MCFYMVVDYADAVHMCISTVHNAHVHDADMRDRTIVYRITPHITTCVAATEKIRYVVITLLERRVLVTSFFIRILDVRKS